MIDPPTSIIEAKTSTNLPSQVSPEKVKLLQLIEKLGEQLPFLRSAVLLKKDLTFRGLYNLENYVRNQTKTISRLITKIEDGKLSIP